MFCKWREQYFLTTAMALCINKEYTIEISVSRTAVYILCNRWEGQFGKHTGCAVGVGNRTENLCCDGASWAPALFPLAPPSPSSCDESAAEWVYMYIGKSKAYLGYKSKNAPSLFLGVHWVREVPRMPSIVLRERGLKKSPSQPAQNAPLPAQCAWHTIPKWQFLSTPRQDSHVAAPCCSTLLKKPLLCNPHYITVFFFFIF